MNIHQLKKWNKTKWINWVVLVSGLSVVGSVVTPIVVLNNINRDVEHKVRYASAIVNDDVSQVPMTESNVENSDLTLQQKVNEQPQPERETICETLTKLANDFTNETNEPSSDQVDQSNLDSDPKIAVNPQPTIDQTSTNTSSWKDSIKGMIGRMDKAIPTVVVATVVSGIIAGGIALVGLIGPASLAGMSWSATAIALEYLICGLLLLSTKTLLENLPSSLHHYLKTFFNSTQLKSVEKVMKWVKKSLTTNNELAGLTQTYPWLSIVKNSADTFVNLLKTNPPHQPRALTV